jgi:hypothetical protein
VFESVLKEGGGERGISKLSEMWERSFDSPVGLRERWSRDSL